MHDERRVAGERFIAALVRVGLVVRRLAARAIRDVVSDPLALLFVPPDQRLALTPRRAVRLRRRAVVEDAAVERPRVTPAVSVAALRLAFVRFVFVLEHAGVDPAAARCQAVVFQLAEMFDRSGARLWRAPARRRAGGAHHSAVNLL